MFELNDRQKAASDFVYGTAIVVAIPGAGKTTVMTHRIASLVKKYNISPESILSLTFTRNAAQSMKEKLKPVLEDLASRVTLSTIHSFCHSLLRQEGKVFEILHGTEQIKFIRKIMKMGKVREIPTGMILQSIGLAKKQLGDLLGISSPL